ncbi:MAG: nucleotidyltransferase family protein [Methanocorpusculum sp.]|nr:nucleotidyltransferase family protein [Methanocorpusculum sp.]
MMEYTSIREGVLAKLKEYLPEIWERFGIRTLAIFGSVARGEENPNSDVDILYEFRSGETTLAHLVGLGDFLEERLGRKVDLVAARALSPYIRDAVIAGAMYAGRRIPIRIRARPPHAPARTAPPH